jgi:hypothetical protein
MQPSWVVLHAMGTRVSGIANADGVVAGDGHDPYTVKIPINVSNMHLTHAHAVSAGLLGRGGPFQLLSSL